SDGFRSDALAEMIGLGDWIDPVTREFDFTFDRLLGTLSQMEILREPTYKVINASRAWYGATIVEFLQTQPALIFAQLASNGEFSLLTTQKDAWLMQIGFLQSHLVGLVGSLFLEFNIPRMGRRIDAVLLIGTVVLVIEFKVGETA